MSFGLGLDSADRHDACIALSDSQQLLEKNRGTIASLQSKCQVMKPADTANLDKQIAGLLKENDRLVKEINDLSKVLSNW